MSTSIPLHRIENFPFDLFVSCVQALHRVSATIPAGPEL
jgi:hypothetical protein